MYGCIGTRIATNLYRCYVKLRRKRSTGPWFAWKLEWVPRTSKEKSWRGWGKRNTGKSVVQLSTTLISSSSSLCVSGISWVFRVNSVQSTSQDESACRAEARSRNKIDDRRKRQVVNFLFPSVTPHPRYDGFDLVVNLSMPQRYCPSCARVFNKKEKKKKKG